MAVGRQPLTVADVEAQVVRLVRRRVLVVMQQDDKADVSSDGHGHIGLPYDGHRQHAAVHRSAGVAGQDDAVPSVQDDLPGGHLDVGPSGSVHHDGDAAEVRPLLLMAAWRSWSSDKLPIGCNTCGHMEAT